MGVDAGPAAVEQITDEAQWGLFLRAVVFRLGDHPAFQVWEPSTAAKLYERCDLFEMSERLQHESEYPGYNWKFFQTHEQTKNFGYTVIKHKNADSIARSIARARDELSTAEEHERYSAERNLEELQKQLQTFHSLSDQQRVRLAAAADSVDVLRMPSAIVFAVGECPGLPLFGRHFKAFRCKVSGCAGPEVTPILREVSTLLQHFFPREVRWFGDDWEPDQTFFSVPAFPDRAREFYTAISFYHDIRRRPEALRCASCGVLAAESPARKLNRCSGCRLTWYCGRACQAQHRKLHKRFCLSEHPRPAQEELFRSIRESMAAAVRGHQLLVALQRLCWTAVCHSRLGRSSFAQALPLELVELIARRSAREVVPEITRRWEDQRAPIQDPVCALQAKLLDSHGTRIHTSDDKGRTLVATRAYDVGEVIMRESPLLVWKRSQDASNPAVDPTVELLQAFQNADEATRTLVLGLYHPPLDTREAERMDAQRVFDSARDPTLPLNLIRKLLAIQNTNCHTYYGHQDNIEYTSVGSTKSSHLAFFATGSMISHSCAPNAMFSSKNSDGRQWTKATKPIAAGEEVTVPYINKLLTTPTFERREKLMQEKAFLCECVRCKAPDYCRVLRCTVRKCGGYTRLHNGTWHCNECASTSKESGLTAAESAIENQHAQNERLIHGGGLTPFGSRRLDTMIEQIQRARKVLSPTHYLVMRLLTQLETASSSLLHSRKQMHALEMNNPQILRRMGMPDVEDEEAIRTIGLDAACQVIRAAECAAAGCVGCSTEPSPHPQVYESQIAKLAFFMGQDLCEASLETRRRFHQSIEKQLPIIEIWLGDEDEDLRNLKVMVANIAAAASVHPSGTRVKLVGLTGSQNLNGTRGTVMKFNQTTERYVVELCAQPSAKARSVNVKQQNLLVVTEGEYLEEQMLVEVAAASVEAERERTATNASAESGASLETTKQALKTKRTRLRQLQSKRVGTQPVENPPEPAPEPGSVVQQ